MYAARGRDNNALMSTRRSAIKEPTRAQPTREKKKTAYTPEELGDVKVEKRQRRWCYKFFEGEDTHTVSSKIIHQGAERHRLADTAVRALMTTYNGVTPRSISFGPHGGCGSGFYCELGQVHRVGRGSLAWLLCYEGRGNGKRKIGRDNQPYYTLVELVKVWLDVQHSRIDAGLFVVYYVNGTMIVAYNMDPKGILPAGLISPVIWFRVPRWTGKLAHPAVTGFARPFRPPVLDSMHQSVRHGELIPDRDGAFVAGGLKLDDEKHVESFEPWVEGDPHFLQDNGDLDDAHFVKTTPPPFSFFDAPNSCEPFTFAIVLIVPTAGAPMIVSAKDLGQKRVMVWKDPSELPDEWVSNELMLPRERRTAFILKRNLVHDQSKKVLAPIARCAGAQRAIVHDPRMALFFSKEPVPRFVSEFVKTKDGVRQLRPPTIDEMLHSIMHDYLDPSQLDEKRVQEKLCDQLEHELKAMDVHFGNISVPLSLAELASLFCFSLFEIDGDELWFSFNHEDEKEQLKMLVRLFGRRAVLLEGPRQRRFTKVLMASSKRGAGIVRFNLHTHLVGGHCMDVLITVPSLACAPPVCTPLACMLSLRRPLACAAAHGARGHPPLQ